ncbi:MAG: LptF/LptG family permease [Planctomycetota bacterium]
MINKSLLPSIRKLDAYILKSFLFALIISTLSLIGLYIVIHFFTNISDFIEVSQESLFTFIPTYYLIRLPLILLKLLPIIMLISVMITIMRFMKTLELVAMLSSGIAIYRIVLPIFITILLVIVMMYYTNEKVIPFLGKNITLTEKILQSEGSERFLIRQADEYQFTIKKYNYPKQQMNDVWINQYDDKNNLITQIFAERGVWSTSPDKVHRDPEATSWIAHREKTPGWLLSNGLIYSYDTNGHWKSAPQAFQQEGFLLASDLTPRSIEKLDETSYYLSLTQLNSLISAQPQNSSLKVQYYSKLTEPLTALILIFIGLPFAIIRKSQSLAKGIGICLIISLTFFIVKFLSEGMGNKGILPPFWAITLPLLIFAVFGIIMSRRIRT